MSQLTSTPSFPAASPAPALAPSASPLPSPAVLPAGVWANDLATVAAAATPWLWHGYLAPGNLTLLTSQWKSGKTTLASVLLARMKGGGQLAGLPLQPGKAVVITEESPTKWQERNQKLDFGSHVCLFCRPFLDRPTPEEWRALLERVGDMRAQHDIRLVVVDPLQSFLPGRNENSAGKMLEALLPLQRLATRGLSVLVQHHPHKGQTMAGQAARGSGALSGYVDILIEMQYCSRASEPDRRHRLNAYSRYEATPRQLVIELNAEGTDYLTHGDVLADEFAQNWRRVRLVLEDAEQKLTRREMLAEWPADDEVPTRPTLWRWLDRAVVLGLVCHDGTGRKNSPYRYWLPETEAQWLQDPMYQLRTAHEEALRLLEEKNFTPQMEPPRKKRSKREKG